MSEGNEGNEGQEDYSPPVGESADLILTPRPAPTPMVEEKVPEAKSSLPSSSEGPVQLAQEVLSLHPPPTAAPLHF